MCSLVQYCLKDVEQLHLVLCVVFCIEESYERLSVNANFHSGPTIWTNARRVTRVTAYFSSVTHEMCVRGMIIDSNKTVEKIDARFVFSTYISALLIRFYRWSNSLPTFRNLYAVFHKRDTLTLCHTCLILLAINSVFIVSKQSVLSHLRPAIDAVMMWYLTTCICFP